MRGKAEVGVEWPLQAKNRPDDRRRGPAVNNGSGSVTGSPERLYSTLETSTGSRYTVRRLSALGRISTIENRGLDPCDDPHESIKQNQMFDIRILGGTKSETFCLMTGAPHILHMRSWLQPTNIAPSRSSTGMAISLFRGEGGARKRPNAAQHGRPRAPTWPPKSPEQSPHLSCYKPSLSHYKIVVAF